MIAVEGSPGVQSSLQDSAEQDWGMVRQLELEQVRWLPQRELLVGNLRAFGQDSEVERLREAGRLELVVVVVWK